MTYGLPCVSLPAANNARAPATWGRPLNRTANHPATVDHRSPKNGQGLQRPDTSVLDGRTIAITYGILSIKLILYAIAILCFGGFAVALEDIPEWQMTILHETALLLLLLAGIISLGMAIIVGRLDRLINLSRNNADEKINALDRFGESNWEGE